MGTLTRRSYISHDVTEDTFFEKMGSRADVALEKWEWEDEREKRTKFQLFRWITWGLQRENRKKERIRL